MTKSLTAASILCQWKLNMEHAMPSTISIPGYKCTVYGIAFQPQIVDNEPG
jgi:hypothetical protein